MKPIWSVVCNMHVPLYVMKFLAQRGMIWEWSLHLFFGRVRGSPEPQLCQEGKIHLSIHFACVLTCVEVFFSHFFCKCRSREVEMGDKDTTLHPRFSRKRKSVVETKHYMSRIHNVQVKEWDRTERGEIRLKVLSHGTIEGSCERAGRKGTKVINGYAWYRWRGQTRTN